MSKEKNKINHQILNREVRITKSDNNGLYSKGEAIRIAESQECDLIEVSESGGVSICVVMDYAKFLFQQKKQEKERQKNQKRVEIKELRFTPNIGEHDLEIKVRQAEKFIKSGDEVKIAVKFSGREMAYQDHGKILIARIMESLQDIIKIKSPITMSGKMMMTVLAPR